MLRKVSGTIPSFRSASPTSTEQSIVEMASINSSLAEETLNLVHGVLPTLSVSETSLILNHETQNNSAELKMFPTSAEKLALEVKSLTLFPLIHNLTFKSQKSAGRLSPKPTVV